MRLWSKLRHCNCHAVRARCRENGHATSISDEDVAGLIFATEFEGVVIMAATSQNTDRVFSADFDFSERPVGEVHCLTRCESVCLREGLGLTRLPCCCGLCLLFWVALSFWFGGVCDCSCNRWAWLRNRSRDCLRWFGDGLRLWHPFRFDAAFDDRSKNVDCGGEENHGAEFGNKNHGTFHAGHYTGAIALSAVTAGTEFAYV